MIFGLPFPNPNDPELLAKLQYIQSLNAAGSRGSSVATVGVSPHQASAAAASPPTPKPRKRKSFRDLHGVKFNAGTQEAKETPPATAYEEGRKEGSASHTEGLSKHDYYENMCMKAVNQSIGKQIQANNKFFMQQQ